MSGTGDLHWGYKFVRPDLTTGDHQGGRYRWRLGGWHHAHNVDEANTVDPCPSRPGDGLCVARTWRGATSGGGRWGTVTVLAVGYRPDDVLAEANDKLRVRSLYVHSDPINPDWIIRPKANLREADLREADLREANLRWADLREANLREANLWEANLWRADLRRANLRRADLRRANLREADLREADLREADLREANLRWADLRWADLRWADLREANLWEANLREANLWRANLRWAKLPAGFTVPEGALR